MKKNFLFGTLAVLLAGFWFGGASLATGTPAVARVGNSECTTVEQTNCYASLADAVADADTGAIITLLANDENSFTSDPMLIIRKELTIDGQNQYYIQGLEDGSGLHFIGITGTGDVTIQNVTIKNFGNNSDVLSPNTEAIMVSTIYEGKLTLKNVTIESFNNRAVVIGGGSFDIDGLTINGNASSTHGQQGIEIHTTTEGNTIKNTVINNVKNHSDSTHFFGIMYDGNGSVEVTNTKINGAGAVVIASPTNGLNFTESNGTITLGAGNEFETNDDVLAIQQMGNPAIHSSSSTIKVTGGTYTGSISKSDDASVASAKFEIEGGTFSEPVLKEFIPTVGKCTEKSTDGTYGIGDCPKSIIRHDSDSDLEGTSRDATVSVNGYNVEVSGPINFYNKGNNQGANRYGLEIVSEGFDSNLTGGAMFTLDGAHWSNRTGDLELGEFGHPNSFFFYPKLTADNKNTPLSVTLNWGPYYEPETFTINHSTAVLKTGITIRFDTDGGDAIDDLVFSGADLTMPDDTGADLKVGDIVASKTGYTFLYWSLSGDDAVYDTGSKVETDMTLKANYTGDEISLTFSVDGTDTVLTGKAGDPFVTAPTLSKTCYNGSWSPALPDTIPAVATTYTAQWSYNCGASGGGSNGGGNNIKNTDKKADEAKADETKAEETKGNEDNGTNNGNDGAPAPESKYSQEMIDAYNWAFKNGITTMPTIEEANMEGKLTRIAMAKMLSFFAINVLGKTPDTDRVVPSFPDVDAQLDKDYDNGVTLAYQLGIMGIGIEEFRPNDEVTRGEFATALSRLLFNTPDGEGAFYEPHLAKLMEEKIITVDTPDLKELRGYVMIMLMRSAMEK